MSHLSGTGTKNGDYVSNSDFECTYYKLGRICSVQFALVPSKNIDASDTILISNLPEAQFYQTVGIPVINTEGVTARGNFAIDTEGNLRNWYGSRAKSGEFIKGGIVYITKT